MAILIGGHLTPTNVALLDACRALGTEAALLPLVEAARRARPGDVVLPRLDVLPSLDGIEPGLGRLRRLEERGVRVVNGEAALIAAHDKLATALKLRPAGIPHPRTAHVDEHGPASPLAFPVVVKPRFGSWGRDVVRCESEAELAAALGRLRKRRWFRRQGALVQELVRPLGYDVRVLVAFGEVIGAVRRIAAPGEWRTNIALGGRRARLVPSPAACATAIAAADAIGASVVGVDLLPATDGYVVIELNGCVDFTDEYSLPGRRVFDELARSLAALEDAALLTPAIAATASAY